MPADLVPNGTIPELAAKVSSPALLIALQHVEKAGVVQISGDADEQTIEILQKLAELGLVDPGYSDGRPFVWINNSNGKRVLKYLETSLGAKPSVVVNPRVRPALASLSEMSQLMIKVTAASLANCTPAHWPKEKVVSLGEDKSTYLLKVNSDLRAFIRVDDSGCVELLDIVRKETLQMFRVRQPAAAAP